MSTPSGPISDGPLSPSNSCLFLWLAIAQAAHSIEEYYCRLFDVLEPARFVSGLLSENLSLGFAIINSLIVTFIFWTYFFRVRPEAASAGVWTWAWSLLELANGIGHVIFAADSGAYFPGIFTAPVLLILSLALIYRLVHPARRAPVE